MTKYRMFPFLPSDSGKIKTFCFYHAGGNVNSFISLTKSESSVAFIPVELSGNGRRKREPLPDSIKQIAAEAATSIADFVGNEEFVLWGHSMGAAVAFETCCCLERYYGIKPALLVVSARQAPGSNFKGLYQCSQGEEKLVEDIRRLGMIPDELLNSKEFISAIIPTIFNDYKINEEYSGSMNRLNVPIVAHYGINDIEATEEILHEWRDVTENSFEIQSFNGNHFYIFDLYADYLHELEKTICKYVNL